MKRKLGVPVRMEDGQKLDAVRMKYLRCLCGMTRMYRWESGVVKLRDGLKKGNLYSGTKFFDGIRSY